MNQEPEAAADVGARPSLIADAAGGQAVSGGRDAKTGARGRRRRNLLERAVVRAISVDEREDLTEPEKTMLKAIEKAVDDEDIESLRSMLPQIAACPNAEIRQEAVDGLGWIGVKAILDLLPFMADSDRDVAQSALDNWTTALAEVSEKRRVSLVEETMKIITDKDALEEIADQFDDCDEIAAIQALVNIIANGVPAQVDAAREEYEFITGEEYTTIEAAEQWLRENYDFEDGGDDAPDADDPRPGNAPEPSAPVPPAAG